MDHGSLEQLFGEPVTTSVTGSPQRVTEAPANIVIVTADEIRRSGARDIPGILRHVAGVDILRWAADNADVSIRGYDEAFSSRTLVLIDGRQVYADFYGFTPWNALPVELNNIRQIEIVKGPGSALFGFNAAGGVINIVTFDPTDDVNNASARAGTQGLAEGSVVATLKLGKVGALRISGGLRSDDEFTTLVPPSMAGVPRAKNSRASIDANLVVHLSEKIDFGLEASHTRARQNDVIPNYTFESSTLATTSAKAQIAADTGSGLLKLTAYSNWISERAASAFGPVSFDNHVSVVQAEDVFNLGAHHTLRAAVEYRHNSVNTSPTASGTIFDDIMSVSGMWNWRASPSVSITNALRFDHLTLGRSGAVPAGYPLTNSDWNRSIDKISINSGLVWRLDEFNTLRLLGGHGVQLPSLADLGAILLVQPFLHVTGNPFLKAASVTSYELAWDQNLPSLNARTHVSVFHQYSDKLKSPAGGVIPFAGGVYFTRSIIGSSIANGIELKVDGALKTDWHWSIGYRAEFVSDRFLPFAAGGKDLVDYEHTTPRHVVKAALGWARQAWEVDAFLRYQSAAFGLQPSGTGTVLVPIDAYFSLDGRAAYRLTNWATIAISGQNLLQARQQQTSGPNIERQVFATLALSF